MFLKYKSKKAKLLKKDKRYNFNKVNNINYKEDFKYLLIAIKIIRIATTKIEFYK